MARRSLRAAHWNEARHPRDDRGRFANRGGGKWVAKVARQMQASFGDISMGAHPDHAPQGKLSTGKGHVIDTRALSKAAPRLEARTPLGPVEAPGGRTGRTAAGRVTGTFAHGPNSATSSHPANAVAHLSKGDHARVQGIDQYGQQMTLNGHVQGVGKVKMGKRGSRAKQDMLAVQMAETPSGANGWRGTVYVKPDATAERTTPKPETTAAGVVVGNTGLDTSRVGRQAGGMTGPTRTNTGTAASNAHGGNFAAETRAGLGAGDTLARDTAPRTGRTPSGRVGGVRQTVSTSDAAERLQSATTREEGQTALEGMSVAELKDVARKLNVRRDQANKQELKDRIVERTVGSRINAGVLRENVGTADVRTGRTAAGELTLRRNEFGFPQTEGPQRPPVSHDERRAASLATRDGIPPTDGRPDITMMAASNSRNDYHRWSLSTSAGRDRTMAPDVARVSGGVLDNKAVSAIVMNPTDGTGEYRYRIVEEGTGKVLEEGGGHDAGEVFAKADRIFSSQRGGGIARTAGNEVHYAARSRRRPKDLSRGDWGAGPFHDFTVVQVDRNGNEKEVVKTNSMDRAFQHAAEMNAKEAGAAERAAAALKASRSTSMADIYNRHRDVTREQFDAMSPDEQQRVLNDLRKVRDSKEQVSHTIPSNRTTMGTTIRGTKNAPHVDAAQAKLRELTYTAPPPVDNSIEGQAARLKAGQLGSFYGTGLTKDRLQAISVAAGYGGFPNTWKMTKVHDYLRARVAAGDAYSNRASLADALRAATSREQARAMLDAQEIDTGLSMAEMKTIAKGFGGTLRGDKRKHMADLVELSVGRNVDSNAIARQANGPTALPGGDALRQASDARAAARSQALLTMAEDLTPRQIAEMSHTRRDSLVRELQTLRDSGQGEDARRAAAALEQFNTAAGRAAAAGKGEAGGTGARTANLEKARTVQREMRAEELTASREPKDNGAKIRGVQSGTIASAELYRKAAAGPSGQRTNLLIGRVRHTPDNPSGEFKITDASGNHTGWASRTVHDGESVYVFHSEDADGGQRLEGWSDSLAVGVDVLNNGHHQATGSGLDSSRTSGGTFERYAGRDKGIAELDRAALNQEIARVRERLANSDLTPGLRTRAEAELARLEAERSGPGAGVDTARVTRDTGGMTATTGSTPKVTGYAKGRELEPGMLVNAADLLPMHESQGNTTGENPNPSGHADWVRVGMVGNTNDPAYKSYNSNRSLTGGMYVVFDQSGHPVGRMSANTIAEINTEDNKPEARLEQVRMPIKVQVQVKDPYTREVHTEERDGFGMVLVPSKFAQQEAGMPAPKMLSDGILDPNDPNYGKGARRPAPTRRPHGERVQGSRTREQYQADRKQRDAAYAASEPQRAARRAELEAQRKADAAMQRAQDRVAAEQAYQVRREQDRRDRITRRHGHYLETLADTEARIYDTNDPHGRPATGEEKLRYDFRHDSEASIKQEAQVYGVKTLGKGVTRQSMIDGIVEALKAGKQPDLERHAPKAPQEGDEAKKIAAADKRRRTGITKDYDQIAEDLRRKNTTSRGGESFHLAFLSDNAKRHLAESLGLGALTGRALDEAIIAAIRAGQVPNLDAHPVTSLKKKR